MATESVGPESNVVPMRLAEPGTRVPPLTGDEIKRLRALLAQSEAILHECPVARHILDMGP